MQCPASCSGIGITLDTWRKSPKSISRVDTLYIVLQPQYSLWVPVCIRSGRTFSTIRSTVFPEWYTIQKWTLNSRCYISHRGNIPFRLLHSKCWRSSHLSASCCECRFFTGAYNRNNLQIPDSISQSVSVQSSLGIRWRLPRPEISHRLGSLALALTIPGTKPLLTGWSQYQPTRKRKEASFWLHRGLNPDHLIRRQLCYPLYHRPYHIKSHKYWEFEYPTFKNSNF